MRKRSFTLVETLIGMGLLAMLLGFFFFWSHQLQIQKLEFDKTLSSVMEESLLQERLAKLFSKHEASHFYTDQEQLILTFNNGIQREPHLSGVVLGHLFFDRQSQTLALGIFPLAEELPHQVQVLADEVDCVEWSFYSPPHSNSLVVDPEEIASVTPSSGWHSSWPEVYACPPALIQLTLSKGETTRLYSFDLGTNPLTYSKESA